MNDNINIQGLHPQGTARSMMFALTLMLVVLHGGVSHACIRCEADDPDIRAEAEAGSARAQYVMAWKYAVGHNTEKNDRLSFAWLKKAADNGYEHAILRLGECYLRGRGVKQDVKEAISLLERAAALFKGGEAAGLLADIYETGTYGRLNRVSAHAWLSLSGRKNKDAAAREMENVMTKAEISSAQARAREWFEQNRNNPPPRSYDFAP